MHLLKKQRDIEIVYILNNNLPDNLFQAIVIFDASAIIQIVESISEELMDHLQKLECKFIYIYPVSLEIMRSESSGLRTSYQAILAQYKFELKSLPEDVLPDMVRSTQEELYNFKCYPSPTDIYLATLLKLSKWVDGRKIYLLTGNLKDFPKQIFGRVDYVILEGNKGVNVLSFLRYGSVSRKIEAIDDIPF